MKKILFAFSILQILICSDAFAQQSIGSSSSSSYSPWLSDEASSKVGGFTFGYVNQIARCFYSDNAINDAIVFQDAIWSDGVDRRLHGFFVGLAYQHQLGNSGFAIYWALRLGYYYSKNKTEAYPIQMIGNTSSISSLQNWTAYHELTFNLPLHIQFSVPLGEGAVGFHTGPAYSYYINGKYAQGTSTSEYDVYKNNEPHSAFFYEIACFYQTGSAVRFDFTWSQGLTERKTYEGGRMDHKIPYYRNKFMAGMTLLF